MKWKSKDVKRKQEVKKRKQEVKERKQKKIVNKEKIIINIYKWNILKDTFSKILIWKWYKEKFLIINQLY